MTLPSFVQRAGQVHPDPLDTADVPVLTDDYSPVEILMFGEPRSESRQVPKAIAPAQASR